MKHVNLSTAWAFSVDPFPAYRCELVYGRNKRDRQFLPVNGIVPDKDETTGYFLLPENKFRIIKTKEKGTILVVNGEDKTDRCLLFVGCAGGFRGGVSVLTSGTTGNILKECSAGNNCESSCSVAVVLEKGQTIAFHSSGRRTNEVYLYTWNWNGAEVEKKHFSKEEWDSLTETADGEEGEAI